MFRSATALFSLLCLAGTVSAIEFVDTPTRFPDDVSTLRGTYLHGAHPGFEGWTYYGGSFLNEFQAVSIYSSDASSDLVILSTWSVPRPEDQREANWLVTDALTLSALAPGQEIVTHCTLQAFARSRPVVIAEDTDKKFATVVTAWLVDPDTGALNLLDSKEEILCDIENY